MENLTVVVPFFNGHKTIKRLLDTLPASLPVVIVDDHSDAPLQLERSNVTAIRPDKKGFFSGACNAGIDSVSTDVLIVNQDAEFEHNRWMALIEKGRDEYAVLGDGVFGHPAWPKGYVQGTFMFIRRDAWEEVGKFNVGLYPLWGATAEWQLRACRAGYRAKPIKDVPGLLHRHKTRYKFGSAIQTALRRWPGRRREFLHTPPLVSVVVPCYNYGRFLPDALHSLLGGPTTLGEWEPQTFQSFEVIIVDDASTDGSREIVEEWGDPWRAIHTVLLDENRGTPGALNAGVERAIGEYIHVLSADDMRESWCLEKYVRHQRQHPDKVIYGNIESFKHGERLKRLRLPDYDFEDLLEKNSMPAGIMYPKQAWDDVDGYPERMVYGREDWAFNIALGIAGWCGFKMPGMSGNLYRREQENRSYRTMGKGWYQRFRSQIQSLFPRIYEGERPVACCGGRSKANRRTPPPVTTNADAMVGKDGFRLLQYVGGNVGSSKWFGPATGTAYTFGDNDRDRVKYVAVEDYDGMLQMRDGRRNVFSVYSVPDPEPDLGLTKEDEEQVNPRASDNGSKPKEADATDAAKQLASEHDIDLGEVEGSGKDGRVVVSDVRSLVA